MRKDLMNDPKFEKEVAGIFVPWAGRKLKEKEGGIYYVGIATDGEWGGEYFYPSNYTECLGLTADMCKKRHDRARTPFWKYLDRLTTTLLGGSFETTHEWWGWSNLFKLGRTAGTPAQNAGLISRQLDECIIALQEEFLSLKNSLIVIASAKSYGVLEGAIPGLGTWDCSHENSGVHCFQDQSGNLYVWGYHPGHAQRKKFFEKQLKATVKLARKEKFHWIKTG
jgi:hypothetical protein